MSSDEMHPGYEGRGPDDDESAERPIGGRPIGGRPIGGRPIGGRPIGGRPIGGRPIGGRPIGGRPIGGRPIGGRPIGGRPIGGRPIGGRPIGGRPIGGRPIGGRGEGWDGWYEDPFDPEVWSAEVSDLVCERSAVISLGATVIADEYELPVPAFDATANAPDYIQEGAEKPRLEPRMEAKLRPRDYELAARIVLPNQRVDDIYEHPELAEALKEDLAEALALRADRAFLTGARTPPPQVQPIGIATLIPLDPALPVAGDLLVTARNMLAAVRGMNPLVNPVFRAPGWVIHPGTLDALTRTGTVDGMTGVSLLPPPAGGAPPAPGVARGLETFSGILRLDGSDGGMFLGYPFIISAAAFDGTAGRIYFSADWREAWVGVYGDLVTVDISTDTHFQTDETVIRATMSHDFILRRPEDFVWVYN